MEAKTGANVFWAFSLLLFPVTVQLLSTGCVNYKYREICGLKGSSVEFPCSYPQKIQPTSILGWSTKLLAKSLKHIPYYSIRVKYLKRRNNDCAMKLKDLKRDDASVYYFRYSFRNASGHHKTCKGVPGVVLHIFESPVNITVHKLVRGHNVLVADWTVIEGQRITLTCSPTCAENLNSNLGYIWYKNRLQLNGSRANSPFLSLGPVSNEDTGSYVCIMIGYKDLPSSAVNLTVLTSIRNAVAPDRSGSNDSGPTHRYDVQSPTDQILNNCHTPKGKSILTLSIVLITCICVGLAITMMISILVFKVKKQKMKNSISCATSVPKPSNPNADSYMSLDISSMSAEYETLNSVRYSSSAESVYEN